MTVSNRAASADLDTSDHALCLRSDASNRTAPVNRAALSTRWYSRFGKRLFDLCFTLAIAPVALPLLAALAAWVACDGGAAFYSHTRVGRDGVRFRCIKLRTMVRDADRRLSEHLSCNADALVEWQATRKLRKDPRVTSVGRVLRATSLDELPQLLNVLRGEMSLVGPRPVTADEIAYYGLRARTVLRVRPGITGPWQVGARNDTTYAERVAIDFGYAQSVSLAQDVGILFKTLAVMVARTGI